MSHHANLHALCRSYCETFGVGAAWTDGGDGATAVRMEIDGVRVTLTQDERAAPELAYAFIDYGSSDYEDEVAESGMLATLMHFNLLLPTGARMRYSRHPVTHRVVFQLVLELDEHDVQSLGALLQRQVRAARCWRGHVQ